MITADKEFVQPALLKARPPPFSGQEKANEDMALGSNGLWICLGVSNDENQLGLLGVDCAPSSLVSLDFFVLLVFKFSDATLPSSCRYS